MERVYPHFTARLVRSDSSSGWRVAAFVQNETSQDLPVPSSGILVKSPRGSLRAMIRPTSTTTLHVTMLSTGVNVRTARIAPLFYVLVHSAENAASILGDLEERYHHIERKSGRNAAIRWYVKQIFGSILALLRAWLNQIVHRYLGDRHMRHSDE